MGMCERSKESCSQPLPADALQAPSSRIVHQARENMAATTGQEPGPTLFYTGINEEGDRPGKAGSAAL